MTDQANDKRQAVPMVDQTRENLDAAGVEQAIGAGVMDAGYYSEANTAGLEERGIDPYLATERLKHNEKIAPVPRGRIPKNLSAKQRMARKLRTKKGREMYAKRKGMIEPIFGQLKQVLGFRQFSMRGLASMRGEWRLMCTVHNLLKLWRQTKWRWRGDRPRWTAEIDRRRPKWFVRGPQHVDACRSGRASERNPRNKISSQVRQEALSRQTPRGPLGSSHIAKDWLKSPAPVATRPEAARSMR